MATRKVSDLQLIQVLAGYQQSYFSISDLEKILGITGSSLYVTIHRLIKNGVLVKLSRGVFQIASQADQIEQVANQLYYPSYLSFESALAIHGILSQQPYQLSLATTLKSKQMTLGWQRVVYHQLKPALFFGYVLEQGRYVAEPEKAVLDQLYLISRGWAIDETDEWSLVNMKRSKLRSYAQEFPEAVQTRVQGLMKRWGRYVVTGQTPSFQASF